MSISKFGLSNFSIEEIEEEKVEIEDYEKVVKRLKEVSKKTWIWSQDYSGIKIQELKKATVEEFCTWAVQAWPPFRDIFKKTLPEKSEFESLFTYVLQMHSLCKFPKGSMGITA